MYSTLKYKKKSVVGCNQWIRDTVKHLIFVNFAN